jgi:hypothetical protein
MTTFATEPMTFTYIVNDIIPLDDVKSLVLEMNNPDYDYIQGYLTVYGNHKLNDVPLIDYCTKNNKELTIDDGEYFEEE